jgi:RNA polymerase sigma-70 factor, ECF subfamily
MRRPVMIRAAAAGPAALALISALPADQAEIIVLPVVAGPGTHEVARIVGKSPAAVRVAAQRGLRRLAATADRAGVTPSASRGASR